jgi:hypothetical protein
VRLPDTGVYQVSVTQPRADEADETATIGFVVPYPAEYALPNDDTVGQPLLTKIATDTGGRIFSAEEPLVPDASAADAQDVLPPEPQELWPWLLLTALVLWPIEIAWRRWARMRIQ